MSVLPAATAAPEGVAVVDMGVIVESPPCVVMVRAFSVRFSATILDCGAVTALPLVATGVGVMVLMVDVTAAAPIGSVDTGTALVTRLPPGATPAAAAMLSICS